MPRCSCTGDLAPWKTFSSTTWINPIYLWCPSSTDCSVNPYFSDPCQDNLSTPLYSISLSTFWLFEPQSCVPLMGYKIFYINGSSIFILWTSSVCHEVSLQINVYQLDAYSTQIYTQRTHIIYILCSKRVTWQLVMTCTVFYKH